VVLKAPVIVPALVDAHHVHVLEILADVLNAENGLNDRGSLSLSGVMGHLKPGVTPAQATVDLNSVGAYLEKTYPRED
jgi:hypothetical protein